VIKSFIVLFLAAATAAAVPGAYLPLSRASAESDAGGPWTSFTLADGLASESLFTLHADGGGHVWVGSNAGVSVLSPQDQWLTLTSGDGLADNIVTDIAADPANGQQRWFATGGGATLLNDGGNPLNKTGHTWVSFTKPDGLVDNHVSAVAVDLSGRLWFGTGTINAEGVESGFGASVLNTNGTPFVKADDTWTTYATANGNLSNDVVRDIVVDGQGTVWVATLSGLNAYSGGTWTVYYTSDGLPSNNIRALLSTANLLWVATDGGVAVFDHGGTPHNKSDDQRAAYTTSNSGLVSNATKSLSMDGAGRIWIGTNYLVSGGDDGAGANALDTFGTPFNRADDTWATFTTSSGLSSNAVRSLLAVGGGTSWFATNRGLSRLNYGSSPSSRGDDAWVEYDTRNRIPASSVSAIADGGAGAWVGTEAGLSYFDYRFTPHDKRNDEWTTYVDGSGPLAFGPRALAVDGKGRLWVGSAGGLMVLDTRGTPTKRSDDVSIVYTSANGLAHDQVNDIVIDSAGRGWIASGSYLQGGLNVVDVGASVPSRSDDIWATFITTNSGLPDPYVTSVALDGNTLAWMGTQNGAAALNYGGTPFNRNDDVWAAFNPGNSGLAYGAVRDVAVDAARNVWFALALEGVSARARDGSWVTFKQADGLANNATDSVMVDRGGAVWIGTDGGGVSVLNYNASLANKADDAWANHSTGNNALASASVTASMQDRWGQIWIGTFGGGASVYSTVLFKQRWLPVARR